MLNKVQAIGNLGKDPEVRFTPNGQAVARMSVAVNEKWKNREGEAQEHTEWLNVVAWGPLAENCGKYLSKGRQVYVEGKLRTRKYDDKDGNTRWITEVIAHDVKFLGGKQDATRAETSASSDDSGDGVPF